MGPTCGQIETLREIAKVEENGVAVTNRLRAFECVVRGWAVTDRIGTCFQVTKEGRRILSRAAT